MSKLLRGLTNQLGNQGNLVGSWNGRVHLQSPSLARAGSVTEVVVVRKDRTGVPCMTCSWIGVRVVVKVQTGSELGRRGKRKVGLHHYNSRKQWWAYH